jgi:hypothetical protein
MPIESIKNIPQWTQKPNDKNQEVKPKHDFLSSFHRYIKNSADMNDTVVVPRTIFKGYLGIMMGTTMLTIGSFIKNKPKFSKGLSIAGLLTSAYGTWAFVRPFIIKDKEIKK